MNCRTRSTVFRSTAIALAVGLVLGSGCSKAPAPDAPAADAAATDDADAERRARNERRAD